MKRRSVHAAFAVLVGACVAMTALEGWQLHRARRLASAIERAADLSLPLDASTPPEARLVRGIALARQGDADPALDIYKDLARTGSGELRRMALFDLGNLHLREAMKAGPDAALRSAPLVELSKQAYRDVLRADPSDWDARFNLEQALRIAPEEEEPETEEMSEPPTRERSISTLQGARIDLP
ncbi:MAG TPA: MxaK protein [Burkholderiaceae bacterium]|nr:MxaK protein [Burkholderiaceae bacterium]